MNHPIHEVISYKYIRFFPDGRSISLYTTQTPKRFLPKIKQHLYNIQNGLNENSSDYNNNITLQTGTYKV